MQPLTVDTLGTLAAAQGLHLTQDELARILPLVQAGRTLMQSVRDALSPDVEPIAPSPAP